MAHTHSLGRNVLSELVYSSMRERILNMDLAPGARLGLDRLAEEYRTSPTPVREALNRLAAEKLVVFEPFKGFSVQPLLEHKELNDLLDVRVLLENLAVESTIERSDPELLKTLSNEIAIMWRAGARDALDHTTFNAADARFHGAIMAYADNKSLMDAYGALNGHLQIARLYKWRGVEDAMVANREHCRIEQAIRSKDREQSKRLITIHINSVRERLSRIFDDRERVKRA